MPYLRKSAFFSKPGVTNSNRKRLNDRKKTIGFRISNIVEKRDFPKILAAVSSPESEISPKVRIDEMTQQRANISHALPNKIKSK